MQKGAAGASTSRIKPMSATADGIDGDPYDAFLSYSHADARVVKRIHSFLQRYPLPEGRGRTAVFLDNTDLRAGELGRELERALSQARSLVIACSPASLESRWVEKETEAFCMHGAERAVVPMVLRGDPEKVIPSSLRDREARYLDLRCGWWFGLLSPGYRLELARGLATISELPLRTMVNWERRRQVRMAAVACLSAVCILLVAAFWPQHYVRDLEVEKLVGPLQSIEFSEVQNDGLLVAARERSEGSQGSRNYVAFFRDVLEGGDSDWYALEPLSLETRALPITHIHTIQKNPNCEAAISAARDSLDTLLSDWESDDADAERDVGPPWVCEPTEGMCVIILPVAAPPVPRGDEGYVTPPGGVAVVAVAGKHDEPRVARLNDFSVPSLKEIPSRSIDLRNGVPVAAMGDTIWVGCRAPENGAPCGLWSSLDGGETWAREDEFSSVASVALDPYQTGRVYVATAPGRWKSGIREGVRETTIWVRSPADKVWKSLTHGPPFSATSLVNFAGFFSDGAFVVQVDSHIYELGRDHLARRLFGSYRRAANPQRGSDN